MSLLPEEKIINYLAKIYHERDVSLNLIESQFSSSPMSDVTFAAVCEYFGVLQHMESLFDDIIEFNDYDERAGGYYINEEQELGLLVFLQAAVLVKEQLLSNNISLEIH
jgi:hypothetical protein